MMGPTDTPAADGRTWPLSFAQRRLWFVRRAEPGGALYHVEHRLRLAGPLDRAVLERCLDELVRRHEPLRTTFPVVDGEPVQRIEEPPAHVLPVTDLGALPPDEQAAELHGLVAAGARRPFDLERDPMLRAALFRLRDGEHVLALTLHHLATDGWSQGILCRELAALYGAYAAGQPSPLPDLPARYADWAAAQRRRLDEGQLEEERRYWLARLEGAPDALDLPFDRPPPRAPTYAASEHALALPPDVTSALRGVGRAEGCTLFITLLAAVTTLLGRLSGQEDVVVGAPSAGRTCPEVEPLVGLFLNTVALRTDLAGDPPFRELLRRVRETVFGALAHEAFPFERVVEELRPRRLPGRHPLFDVLVNYTDQKPARHAAGALVLEPLEVPLRSNQFALTLYASPRGDELALNLAYREELFSSERVLHLLQQLCHLLRQVAAAPATRLGAFDLVTPEARAALPDPTAALDAPAQEPVTASFARRAAEAPEQPALSHAGGTWSYARLHGVARGLADRLAARGGRPGDVVAVSGERSPGIVAALLGTLFAGRVALPLDPSLPPERKRLMLQASGARDAILVGLSPAAELWLAGVPAQEPLALDLDGEPLGGGPPPAPAYGSPWAPDDARAPAYVFFTSGSAGAPKAILGSHAGLAHFIRWQRSEFGLRPHDRVALVTPLSFDVVLRDVFLPLTSGATLCLPRPGLTADGRDLLPWLASERVSVLHAVPTVARGWLDGAPDGPSLDALRLVFFAGEPLADSLVLRWRSRCREDCEVVNLYGPTETTLAKCFHRVPLTPALGIQPVGRPLPDTQALLLNDAGRPCGVGEPGEIVLRTPFRSLGYLDLPAQPGFLRNPFRDDADDVLYRTGDLGRFLPDGTLAILGRRDDQLKIRGVRIEPAEVAAALGRHPAVRECAVVPVAGEGGEPRLVAFVAPVTAAPGLPRELRVHLGRELPLAAVPSRFVLLDRLPRSPNGKVDRRALPLPTEPAPAQRRPAPPETPLQAQLVALWAELLGRPDVGIDDDFFELGGHSLLAARLAARLRKLLGLELPLRDLFESPTVAELATKLEGASLEAAPGAGPAPSHAPPAERPLSFAQRRLWFQAQLRPDSPQYHIPVALRLRGALDRDALGRALDELLSRHAVLRTTYPSVAGEPVQRVAGGARLPLRSTDLSDAAPDERPDRLRALLEAEVRQPFELARDLPLRGHLVRLDGREHVLCLTLHHVAADGWSLAVLHEELGALYGAFAAGRPSPLPALPFQYADHADGQRQRLQGPGLQKPLEYWRQRLAGAPATLDLPTDRPRPPAPTDRGDRRALALDAALRRSLSTLARAEGATLFMALLAAFQALLSRYGGVEDVVVGTPVAGRDTPESEKLIGLFVNTLALRTDLSGDPTFRELLRRVRGTVLDALEHQELPFERLVEELRPEREPGLTPFFRTMFALHNTPEATPALPGLDVTPEPCHTGASKFDLGLALSPDGDGLRATAEFSCDLFEAATIERMLGHLHTLLQGAVADPDRPVGRLPLLGADERRQVLVAWNGAATEYPRERTVHELFEEQAGLTPGAVAVTCGPHRLSYRELDESANRLSHHLRRLGVAPETPIGVALERSTDVVVALLAILKAGGAYVPFDPDAPAPRLAFMAADAGVPLLVTQEKLAELVPAPAARRVLLDRDRGALASESPERPPPRGSPGGLAYVMYTSGSSGRPKGVCVPHRGIVRLVRGTTFARLDALEVFLHLAPLAFDASTLEIWGALLNGARLVVAPPGVPSLSDLGRLVREEGVTTLALTASLFNSMIDRRPQDLRGLRQLLSGGDVFSPAHAWRARQALPGCTIINAYGPTENTTLSCCHSLRDADRTLASIPIGRPIANSTAYVLDRHLQPVPIGVPGELYLGGDGLALGYLNSPELDAERFVVVPVRDERGERLYRSGDQARWLPDGTLEFLGRKDGQVKIRGFRVELAEVEAHLARHPGVRQCAAVARKERDGERSLAAAIVPADSGAPPEPEALREFLRTTVPPYMIPSGFLYVGQLPLTANGKVDRAALQALPLARATPEARFVGPRDPSQRLLTSLWEELLGVRPISVRDDFFALGGHSLLATSMLAQVEELFGRKVSLPAFFAAPTVAALSQALVTAERDVSVSPLVLVQPGDGERPLFFLHGDVLGGGFYCRKLARSLGERQTFYALHPHGMLGRAPGSIESMAAEHLPLLRAAHPGGPYLLGGHCNGALEAYELARRLRDQGAQVDLLVMLSPPRRRSLSLDALAWRGLRLLLRPIMPLVLSEAFGRWSPWLRSYLVMAAYAALSSSYLPRPYPGRTLLLQPRAAGAASRAPARGWGQVAGDLEVLTLPPGHDTALTSRVEELAELIRPRLRPLTPR